MSAADIELDTRTATLKGRVSEDLLDEIRTIVARAYRDGYEDAALSLDKDDSTEEGGR